MGGCVCVIGAPARVQRTRVVERRRGCAEECSCDAVQATAAFTVQCNRRKQTAGLHFSLLDRRNRSGSTRQPIHP